MKISMLWPFSIANSSVLPEASSTASAKTPKKSMTDRPLALCFAEALGVFRGGAERLAASDSHEVCEEKC